MHDDQRRRTGGAIGLDSPDGAEVAVDEERTLRRLRRRGEPADRLGNKPAAVVVGQDDIVVLGEEAGRSGRVGMGSRRVGKVVQLPAALVAEGAEPRPEPVGDLADAGEPAPGGDVGVARRAERGKVAKHHLVDARVGLDGLTEPCLGSGESDLGVALPQAARRSLDQGQMIAAGVGQGGAVVAGEALLECGAKLGAVERALGEDVPAGGLHRVDVDGDEAGRVVTMVGELPVEHRLHEWPQDEAIVGGDEVDRAPHHDDPHELSLFDQRRELAGVERFHPRPQGGVGVVWDLCLQADEVFDGLLRRAARPLQEELAMQRRPVELALRENVGGHSAAGTDSYVFSSTRLSSGSRM